MFGAAELATASNKNVVTISEILSEKLKSGFLKYYEYLHPNMRTHRERERNDTLIKCPIERCICRAPWLLRGLVHSPHTGRLLPGASHFPAIRCILTPHQCCSIGGLAEKKLHKRKLKHTLERGLHLSLPQRATANARLPGAFLGSEKKQVHSLIAKSEVFIQINYNSMQHCRRCLCRVRQQDRLSDESTGKTTLCERNGWTAESEQRLHCDDTKPARPYTTN